MGVGWGACGSRSNKTAIVILRANVVYAAKQTSLTVAECDYETVQLMLSPGRSQTERHSYQNFSDIARLCRLSAVGRCDRRALVVE